MVHLVTILHQQTILHIYDYCKLNIQMCDDARINSLHICVKLLCNDYVFTSDY